MSDSKEISLQGKHILVTGGAGYIGSHTVVELLKEGAKITIIDNLDNSSEIALDRVHQISGSRPPLHIVDLCDFAKTEEVFKTAGHFDACIHFAGLKAVGESSQIPLRYYDNNLSGTLNLLQLLEKYECPRLVFSSSATVYGMTENLPINEGEPLSATNPYGRTKLMIEDILRDVAKGKTGPSWRIAILRYFNPVGAHESGLIGEDPQGIPNNLLPFITQVAVGKLPILSVFGDDYATPDGTGVRDYIHVVDLARGHVAALRGAVFTDRAKNCDEFNLGTGRGNSVYEMIRAVEKASGRRVPYKVVARRPGDVGTCYADPCKAEMELGWKAELSIEKAVADAWNWQKSNPNGFREAPSA